MKTIYFILFTILTMTLEASGLLIIMESEGDASQTNTAIQKFEQKLSKKIPYQIVVLDHDRKENEDINSTLSYLALDDKSLPEGYNEAVKEYGNSYDFYLFTSDFFEPVEENFDLTLKETLQKDPDQVLNIFPYGMESINVCPVISKTYYHRFNYAFFPEYKASCYPEELTLVSRILGKETVTRPLLKLNGELVSEENGDDKTLFLKRRAEEFSTQTQLDPALTKDWSILICTLDEREKVFAKIYGKITDQIKTQNLENRIEVLFFKDNREYTVGHKRNSLLKQSRGRYVNFVDDDDDVHPEYVKMIYEKLQERPDCVNLIGIITFNGQSPAKFIHSVKYKTYFQTDAYYRPPNHLNPMKRNVASQFLFPDKSYGEDTDWAMRIARANLLSKEQTIDVPYYFYHYVDK